VRPWRMARTRLGPDFRQGFQKTLRITYTAPCKIYLGFGG
jgi:hypothetical protein